jgi:SAM-dependent methyltransferase
MSQKPDIKIIQEAIKKKYRDVSLSSEGIFKYPSGRKGVLYLGYDPSIVKNMPDELIESFCGVGNPFISAKIREGETLLDTGCGAGFDLIMAGRLIGSTGYVYGIDLTPEMVEKARKNLKIAGILNSKIEHAGAEFIPFEDNKFDIVISNGVINLSPDKKKCFGEIYRVLKEGGRFHFADIILKEDLPEEVSSNPDAWSD